MEGLKEAFEIAEGVIVQPGTYANWEIDLAEGSFVTNRIQARASYNFSPLVYLQAFLQYNDDADTWSSNVRFSWLNTAGTGLFIVYNDTESLGNMLIGRRP